MYLLYSVIYTIAFVLLIPLFILRREKYASGFAQRLGNYLGFRHDDRKVIWLHCVSVGETNAARPLVEGLVDNFPDHRLVISTTTRTGQELAQKLFGEKADAVVYFPFDFKFTVRRALATFRPSLVLLMETEIWPRFIHEAKLAGSMVAIVNGRLSQRSFQRYGRIRTFINLVLSDLDLAMMQNEADAERLAQLGIPDDKVVVTGNLKFEQAAADVDDPMTAVFRSRFGIDEKMPLIVAASTHEPEERKVVSALDGELGRSCRLMIVPRHPERFDAVADLLKGSPYSFARRSSPPSAGDEAADVILLDTIGELRAAYPLAEIVFVGGSLLPHGGQSVLEPASAGKAIITGPHTENFTTVLEAFRKGDAICQLPNSVDLEKRLADELKRLLGNSRRRAELGQNALAVIRSSPSATRNTIEFIRRRLTPSGKTEN